MLAFERGPDLPAVRAPELADSGDRVKGVCPRCVQHREAVAGDARPTRTERGRRQAGNFREKKIPLAAGLLALLGRPASSPRAGDRSSQP